MKKSTNCPNNNLWCVDHEGLCASPPITVSDSCSVWLLQETTPGIEPVIVVDTRPTGGEITLAEAENMQAALGGLRQAALDNKPVRR